MKNKLITSMLMVTIASLSWADWTVEHDFESGLPAGIYQAGNTETATGFADVVDGMLSVHHGDLQEATTNLYCMVPLSADLRQASLDAGGAVTMYFEMMIPEVNGSVGIVDVAFGLSNIDPDEVAVERYNSFNAMMRIDSGDQNWEARDGGSYVELTPLEAGVKYSVWMVVDYTLNFVEVYAQGGIYTEQTNVGLFAFRVDPAEGQTVDYFNMLLSDGNSVDGAKGVDSMQFDNFVIDTAGQNLSMPAVGGWVLEHDFNSGLPAGVYQAGNTETATGYADVVDGMLSVHHGDLQEATTNLYCMVPLSTDLRQASLDAGGAVTTYFEMMIPEVNGSVGIVDVAFGLSNIDPDEVAVERYNSFNAMMRIDSGDQNWEARDGGSYVELTPLEAGVKYSVWLVVDYTLNFVEVYAQGGIYTEQTNVGLFAFRVDPAEGQTVDYFNMLLSDGNSVDGAKGVDSMQFDNFYTDPTGQNLGMPSGGGGEPTDTWAGYTIANDVGDVDTGDWLGWINTFAKPWIWSYSLSTWMYIDESAVGPNGSWIYIAK